MTLHIGCAGWNIPKIHVGEFPPSGSHLERYAARLNAVEINTSFYRPHRPATYARWRREVPDDFRFAVKMPRTITHEARLVGVEPQLARFLGEVAWLEEKLGPLLVQLPPSLRFRQLEAEYFFQQLRGQFSGSVVCEPRHDSWFEPPADALLAAFHVARVAADPAPAMGAERPGGFSELVYYRLHGSPRCYYSAYEEPHLARLAETLGNGPSARHDTWCIFDNTAEGAATANALDLAQRLADRRADNH